uniref:NADH-ubiquinone oxidoreductase chain 2 n=1 Tax=Lepidapion squamigerum TaxID=280314 RepID=A0A6B9EUP4_9CUCU|nr:NADH dehydrogenase subunit 2 [Lepidapion squamigerum]
MKLYKIMFFCSMMFGTILAISSYSWLSMWIGLEINLLSFIPLMTNSKNMYPSEAALKYFITQTLASNIFLFTLIIMMQFYTQLTLELNTSLLMLLNSALFLKLGMAPFHFWLPEVISGLNWNNSLILLTWQKIAPMILIMYNLNNLFFISMIILFSSLTGGIQNFNQTNLQKFLAYSSINHMAWMTASMLVSFSIWLIYFIFYMTVTLNIIMIFKMFNIFKLNQLFNIMTNSKMTKFFFILNFLSLSGLPPFLGFLPKWLTLNFLINNKFFILSLFLVIFTLISMYIYLRITFTSITMNSQETIMFKFHNPMFLMMNLNFLSLCGLMSITLLYLF